jgi:hypothetical protein
VLRHLKVYVPGFCTIIKLLLRRTLLLQATWQQSKEAGIMFSFAQ